METISYVLPAIIVALGLLCGFILGKIAKEELRPGKKYFFWVQGVLVLMIITLAMYNFRNLVYSRILGGLAVFLYLYYFSKIKPWMVYLLFGIVYQICFGTKVFLFVASAMFLYGFPTGSLNSKDKQKLVICVIVFLIVSLGMGFV